MAGDKAGIGNKERVAVREGQEERQWTHGESRELEKVCVKPNTEWSGTCLMESGVESVTQQVQSSSQRDLAEISTLFSSCCFSFSCCLSN